MPLKRLGNETVTVLTAPLVTATRDNSLNRDWSQATEQTIINCSVQPFRMSYRLIQTDFKDREYVQEYFRLYIPAGQPIPVHTDKVLWRSTEFDSYGPSQSWYDRKGNLHHTQVVLRFREG